MALIQMETQQQAIEALVVSMYCVIINSLFVIDTYCNAASVH